MTIQNPGASAGANPANSNVLYDYLSSMRTHLKPTLSFAALFALAGQIESKGKVWGMEAILGAAVGYGAYSKLSEKNWISAKLNTLEIKPFYGAILASATLGTFVSIAFNTITLSSLKYAALGLALEQGIKVCENKGLLNTNAKKLLEKVNAVVTGGLLLQGPMNTFFSYTIGGGCGTAIHILKEKGQVYWNSLQKRTEVKGHDS
ncbi:MAG: hypothetical protein S4CHLAM7_01260 [Chlamydiae bacterium]|nr:hypothetical protein [Chlamydiota bacterium]